MRIFRIYRGYCLIGILCCLVIACAGCGYTTRSMISSLYQTIYIEPFINKIDITTDTSVARGYKTYYPLLENDITRQVIDDFIFDGNLKVAKHQEADLVLKGELVNYRKDALRYTGADDDEVEEYRITIAVNLKLYDEGGENLVWEVNNFAGDTTYFASGSESTAIRNAVGDLSRRVIDRVVDVW